MGQKYLTTEDQKLGWCINRMLQIGKDLNHKLMFSKYVLNCGGAVKKLM